MQDNKERLENRDGLAENENEKIPQVMDNQESLFGDEEVFTEAMVVEKDEISVDSSENATTPVANSNGDTAIFTFSKDKNKKVQTSSDELTVSDIEKGAKEYYNANHADDIQDKVKAIYERANSEFSQDDTADAAQAKSFENGVNDSDEELGLVDEYAMSVHTKKNKHKGKKRKKHGYVSDDDMQLLSDREGGITLHDEVKGKTKFTAENTDIDSIISDLEDSLSKEEIPVDSIPKTQYDVDENNTQKTADFIVQDEIPKTQIEEETTYEDQQMPDDDESRLFAALGKDDAEEYIKKYEDMCDDALEYEYTSTEQESDILMNLRNTAMKCMMSVFATLIATIVCAYFEIAAITTLPTPDIFTAGRFGVTYAMSMLQIMFLCVIFNLDGVKRAFKGLRPGKSSNEGFSAVIISVCTIHSVVSCLVAGNVPTLRSFCTVGCLALLFLSINSFFKAQTSLSAFCIAASKKPKFSCSMLERDSEEGAAFEKYLDDDSDIVTVDKSNFVEGFFKKINTVPCVAKNSFKRVCVTVALALAVGVVAGIFKTDVYFGFMTFAVVSLTSLPVSALLVTAYPFFKATSKAMDSRTAFIGEAVCDNYDDTNVISFDDTEVFSPKRVKVTSIKTYENNRIDKVILYMAKVFEKLGGPMSFVFANSVHDIEENRVTSQIKSCCKDGICAEVDGKTLLVGTADFMMFNGLVPVEDNIDETFLNSCGSIMYMAADGEMAAKFYVKYSINEEFEDMLRSFYDAGVCVAIKTLDPCITTELVTSFLRGTNYPVAVISKGKDVEQIAQVNGKTTGAIISLSGVHSFLKGFIKADKLRNVYRTNSGFSVVSMIVGVIASSFGMLFANSAMFGVLFMVVFQLVWCLPTLLISNLSNK